MNMLPSVGKSVPVHNRSNKPSDGQVVKGKVLQLLNAKEAIVEINGRAMKATIEVPLKPGASYLFQVFREPDNFHLKMIKEIETAGLTTNESVNETISYLGLPMDSHSKTLVKLFFQHNWPLKQSLLMQSRRLIDLSGRDGDWEEALKTIFEKNWPLKESLFKALAAVQNKETAQTLNTLLSELRSLNLATPAHKELQSLLKNWPSIAQDSKDQWLKNIFDKTGYFYEAELMKLAKGVPVDKLELKQSLKGLLITMVQNGQVTEDTIQKLARDLLQQINGQQLQSLQMDKSFVQIVFTFPLRFQDKLRDVHLFWEGKRQTDGTVDPNYFKIAFRVDLPHLKETILHILVQERRITISVYNDLPFIEPLIRAHGASLAENLNELGFYLASVKQHMGKMPEAEAIFQLKTGNMDVSI